MDTVESGVAAHRGIIVGAADGVLEILPGVVVTRENGAIDGFGETGDGYVGGGIVVVFDLRPSVVGVGAVDFLGRGVGEDLKVFGVVGVSSGTAALAKRFV